MSLSFSFDNAYAAGTTTALGDLTFSAGSVHLLVAFLIITNDGSGTCQIIDATYSFNWNGTSLTVTKDHGTQNNVFSWSVNGGTATLSITPAPGAAAGAASGNAIMTPAASNVAINF